MCGPEQPIAQGHTSYTPDFTVGEAWPDTLWSQI